MRGLAGRALAVSPDGSTFVYTGPDAFYLRRMDGFEDRPIAGSPGEVDLLNANPTFSPDGRWLAYFQAGQLRRIAVAGGASVAIAPAERIAPAGISWEADGTILYAQLAVAAYGAWPAIGWFADSRRGRRSRRDDGSEAIAGWRVDPLHAVSSGEQRIGNSSRLGGDGRATHAAHERRVRSLRRDRPSPLCDGRGALRRAFRRAPSRVLGRAGARGRRCASADIRSRSIRRCR